MFIKVRDTNDNLKLLNVNHIISVEPHSIKKYRLGDPDTLCTKINSIGAMVSTTIVYDSVEKIEELIESTCGA